MNTIHLLFCPLTKHHICPRIPLIDGLRLDGNTVEGLERMGLRKIGDLYTVPRAPLSGRFGGAAAAAGSSLGNLG